MGFTDRLDAAVARTGPPCTSCAAIAAMNEVDLAEFHEARDAGKPLAQIARALGIQAGTYRLHVSAGHDELR